MIITFLSHQWKSFWRSRGSGKNLALQLLVGFFSLYIVFSALGIGFFLKKIITEFFPGQNLTSVFCRFILYYFVFDILVRFQFQNLPTLAIQPYLIQNIGRKKIVGFLNIRSLFAILNVLPLLLFIPFTVVVIAPEHGALAATLFIVCLISLSIFNHFLVMYIKRKSVINSWWYVLFFILIVSIILLDYFNVFSLSQFSSLLFAQLLKNPWLFTIALVLPLASFYNNYVFLKKNLYFDSFDSRTSKIKDGKAYAFLNRFGTTGELMRIDLKLLLRNKRPRTILTISILFLLYGFVMFKQEYIQKEQWGIVMFAAIFLTGLFITNYGQLLFAWQSSHFDGLMAANLDIRTYIKSKFLLLNLVSTITFLISLLYGLIDWHILPLLAAGYLFNIGINTLLTCYFATRSYKGINLGKGASFNFQGIGLSQWIYALLIFVIPLAIYLPLAFFFNKWVGAGALGGLGLINLLLQNWWIKKLTTQFIKRKYLLLEGFREEK